jgi:hypothetical protein
MGLAMLRFPSRVGFSCSFFVFTLGMVFHITGTIQAVFVPVCRIRITFGADPDPTFHFDAVPDPSFQKIDFKT